ncbi:hypothetical protein LZC95_14530 [Pendulispora brunnea]|uniref:Uncharacterized protein n=1 Tax=Pendulispora brunnea TaxID=2905690 RepID=A0ABZ2KJ20_9BACT
MGAGDQGHLKADIFLFPEERNLRIFTCDNVVQGRIDARNVFHQDDGDWQFLCGGDHGEDGDVEDRIHIACLECTVARDPTLNAISKMPRGHHAVRKGRGEPWFVWQDGGEEALGRAEGDSENYVTYVTESSAWLGRRQDAMHAQFGIRDAKTWHYDQDTGLFTFTFADRPPVLADFEKVGSVSTRSNTWLWSWANESTEPRLTLGAQRARDFGRERDWLPLWLADYAADEVDGWEMSAIVARLTNAEGCYRAPSDWLYLYFTLRNLRCAD